uniref:Solute carrier family 34 member 2a n=1 Tax=Hucho hucho TaxID=62062 RepID=A0A4W5KSF0_9TELE
LLSFSLSLFPSLSSSLSPSNSFSPSFPSVPLLYPPGKVLRVVTSTGKGLLLLGFLYMFICSLDILSSAFQLIIYNLSLSLSLSLSQVASGYMYKLAKLLVDSFNIQSGEKTPELLHVITDPLTKAIIELDKSVISGVATGDPAARNKSLILKWCKTFTNNCTSPALCWCSPDLCYTLHNISETYNIQTCNHLFVNVDLSDLAIGLILLALSLLVLCSCLILIVKLLNSMLKGQVAVVIKKVLNTDFPFPFGWVTGYIAILVGAGMTFIVQSSSVFTSAITPLVGIGVISIERAYPLSLGANIGTTTTAILAAMAAPGDSLANALQIALIHFVFNVSGIIMWYSIPFTRIPIRLAKALGNITAEHRWFAGIYIISCFFLLPLIIFGLSMAGWKVLVGVGVPIVALLMIIIIVNLLQERRPSCLPTVLRSWDFLPLWAHSLEPWDRVVAVVAAKCCCCCKGRQTGQEEEEEEEKKGGGNFLEMYDNPAMTSGVDWEKKREDKEDVLKATQL